MSHRSWGPLSTGEAGTGTLDSETRSGIELHRVKCHSDLDDSGLTSAAKVTGGPKI